MTPEKYLFYVVEVNKIRRRPEILSAIETQTKLSLEAKEKEKKRYETEDKLIELYHSIPTQGIDDSIFGGQDRPEHERLIRLIDLWMENNPKLDIIRETLAKSGKQEEIGKLENELQDALFEFYLALIKLDSAINDSRQKLFSEEYKAKLKEYADQGVLLYFLETPDAPILCPEITIDDVLESFSYGNCVALKTLFYHFVAQDSPSPSMKMKIEDIVAAVECLANGHYRAAARTVFALLDSEHKNCSSAMGDFFALAEKAQNGKQRAEKIQQLLEGLKEQTYFSMVWDIVNPLYKDILDSKVDSFIDRNSIIHGDYYSEKLDITEKDVIKLLLLFLNMRMISDHVQLYCEMFRNTLKYSEIYIAQELKKKAN